MPSVFLHHIFPSVSSSSLSLYSPVLWEPLRKSFSVVGLYPTGGTPARCCSFAALFCPSGLKESLHSEKPRCPTQAPFVMTRKHQAEFPVRSQCARVICVSSALCTLQPKLHPMQGKSGIPPFHFRLSAFTMWFGGHLKGIRRKDRPRISV